MVGDRPDARDQLSNQCGCVEFTKDDFPALQHFPLGQPNRPWLAEVAELVSTLPGWLQSIEAVERDRHVLLLDDDGEIIGVAAHEAVVDAASVELSRSVFPDADETSPPEDKPYVAFTLHLREASQ